MSDPTYDDSAGDPTEPDPYAGGDWQIVKASRDVWAAIAKFVDSRLQAKLVELVSSKGDLANVACTMGTPGVDATPSATEPWGFVVVPFYSVLERIDYYIYPTGATYTVDVKIIRPGQTLADAQSIFPGPPPTIAQILWEPTDIWTGYLEEGTVLVFYLTAASGGLRICTANLIVRTVPS